MDTTEVLCPSCQAAPITIDDNEANVDPCAHLAFIYHTQADDFEFAAPAFLTKLPEDVMAEWNLSRYEDILESAGLTRQLAITEVQLEPYGHFGSRPTLVVGFYCGQ